MTFDSNADLPATFPRFTPEARKANQPVVDLLSAMSGSETSRFLPVDSEGTAQIVSEHDIFRDE